MESLKPIEAWFAQQGWKPALFQRQTWKASLEGASGLIQVPTGSGKTYAAVLGPIAKILAEKSSKRGVRLLYITPLRALSRDLAVSIQLPISEMNWPIRVGTRNGDTTSTERNKQLRNTPEILITQYPIAVKRNLPTVPRHSYYCHRITRLHRRAPPRG